MVSCAGRNASITDIAFTARAGAPAAEASRRGQV
jgi:hypothetical protein